MRLDRRAVLNHSVGLRDGASRVVILVAAISGDHAVVANRFACSGRIHGEIASECTVASALPFEEKVTLPVGTRTPFATVAVTGLCTVTVVTTLLPYGIWPLLEGSVPRLRLSCEVKAIVLVAVAAATTIETGWDTLL